MKVWVYRRSPHGERGLKSFVDIAPWAMAESLPSRGAWIEIGLPADPQYCIHVAPLTGSVD